MKSFIRNNSLSLVLFLMFIASFAGQIACGQSEYNKERTDEGATEVSLTEYLQSGHFVQ